MKQEDRQQIAIDIAKMYYVDGWSQESIAEKTGMSRSNVSRIIRKCLDDGIVQVMIHDPITENPQLAKKLKEKYGLKEVIITPSSTSRDRLSSYIGERLSLYLMKILEDGMLLGVAKGRSVLSVGKRLDRARNFQVDVVQIQGSTTAVSTLEEGGSLVSLYSSKFSGNGFVLHAPLIAKNKDARLDLMGTEIINRVVQLYQRLDVAILEIEKPVFFANQRAPIEHLTRADILQLSEVGAKACICGYYYDKNGKPCNVGIRERVIGIEPDQLKRIKYSIGISAGIHYLDETLSILKTGFINVLVIDEKLAEKLDE